MVNAVILLKAQVQFVNELAKSLVKIPGVNQVFSVAGHYDLVVLVGVRENAQLADLVSDHIRKVPGIVSTETLIAFRVYTSAELQAASDLGID